MPGAAAAMAFQHGPPSPHGRRDSSRRGNSRSSLTDDGSNGYGRSRELKNGYGPKTGGGYFSDDSGMDDGERRRDSLTRGRSGYEVDHLVTWSVGSKGGVLTPEDGVRELRIMEQQTGIWTMRCILEITPTYINIVDGQSGEEREKFPLDLIETPAAFSSDPRVDAYNNLLLFTILEDPKNKHAPSEMHIFQVLRQSARDLVDDINEIKFRSSGKNVAKPSPPLSSGSRQSIGENRSSVPDIRNPEISMLPGRRDSQPKPVRRVPEVPVESGTIENYVTLLNRCFDEIERFVARLQMSADAFKELDRRMKMRSKAKSRHGDGMLTMRARAPPPHDFMDIFQKFKLCFNLLALLKNHIHDPNAPELVHFLFTPLSLIVEASKDPHHGHPDIAMKAISPILSREAKELLQHCLTSKEADLWMALGDAWTISRDQWTQGYVPPFHPKFDGWEPPHTWLEEVHGNPVASAVASVASRRISELDRVLEEADNAPPRVDYRLSASGIDLSNRASEQRATEQRPSVLTALATPPLPATAAPLRTYIPSVPPAAISPPQQQQQQQVPAEINGIGGLRRLAWDDAQKQYLRDLQSRNARIYEAAHDRQGNNAKELNTTRGEVVEVLDDSRNWWKCRNYEGTVGHIPYTILKKYGSRDDGQLPDSLPSPGQLSDTVPTRFERQPSVDVQAPAPPPPPPPPPVVAPPVILPKAAAAPKPVPPKVPAKKDSIGDAAAMAASIAAEIRRRVQLYSKTNQGPPKALSRPSPVVFIDHYSTADDVAKWLEAKGFQQETKITFESCTGRVLFELTHDEIFRYLGRDEGARLESQLKLMKVEANYTVNSSSELKAILNRQRERANSTGSDETATGTAAGAAQTATAAKGRSDDDAAAAAATSEQSDAGTSTQVSSGKKL